MSGKKKEGLDRIEEDRTPTRRCLVSMPFAEKWSDEIYGRIESIMQRTRIDIFRVDYTGRCELDLLKDIEAQIKSVDIVIADVTSKNTNVHIEIGYALANRKPILYITQNKNDVSSLITSKLYYCYDLDDAGLNELARYLFLRIGEVVERIDIESERQKLEMANEPIYQAQCFKDRELANLHQLFAEARNRIDILTTNLSWLCMNIEGSQETYLNTLMNVLEDKDRTSLKVRILTLDPESDIATGRGRQLGFSAENFRNQLRSARDEVKSRGAAIEPARFEGRIYRELPTQITFRIDRKILTCVVGQPMQSRYYPVIEFDVANPGVKEAFLAHFLSVWKNADPM